MIAYIDTFVRRMQVVCGLLGLVIAPCAYAAMTEQPPVKPACIDERYLAQLQVSEWALQVADNARKPHNARQGDGR